MRKALLVIAAVAALVLAAAAGAVAEKVFKMGVGDSAFVKGSSVACGVSHNSTIGNAMTCFKRRGKNTQVGSYAVQLGDNYAALMRVTSTHGNTKPLSIKKQP
jgi:hypothetical protein